MNGMQGKCLLASAPCIMRQWGSHAAAYHMPLAAAHRGVFLHSIQSVKGYAAASQPSKEVCSNHTIIMILSSD
jgi:hypothetical protein